MSALNIEMIAKSLRNFSLSGRSRSRIRSPPPPGQSPPRRREEGVELTVELNSEVALPCHWEQCLDMGTGQVYYRNWTTGKITTEDPRLANNNGNYYSSSSSDESSDDDDSSTSNEANREKYFSSEFGSSSSSSTYEVNSAEVNSVDPRVLVAAGCHFCFTFFMVPKHDFSCPKCGRLLLHLGRNG